ncbi:MAG: CDP-diacylglycerol--glycerol-3-phosphate 3-phosphatidyltransferase [Brevinema sp.]
MPKFILNIPNSLTILRLFCVPLASFPLLPIFGEHTETKLLLVMFAFVFAAITDFLDGYFARKLNQMSDWGAYMDPLIDKFLIWALFLVFLFVPFMEIPVWTFIVILFRDLAVTEMRNFAIKHDIAFKTSFFAKTKTAVQMVVGGGILVFLTLSFYLYQQTGLGSTNYLEVWSHPTMYYLPKYLVVFTALLTGATGVDYAITLWKNMKNKKTSH